MLSFSQLLILLISIPYFSHALLGNFIIKFRPGVDQDNLISLLLSGTTTSLLGLVGTILPGRITYRYDPSVFNGVAGIFDNLFITQFASLHATSIEYVEPDREARAYYYDESQTSAPWGLVRLSQSAGGGSSYVYPTSAGEGVNVYVLDTGVDIYNPDFGGRAYYGANFVTGEEDRDLHGHGTHCAAIVAGRVFGVAKRAKIISVKVLGKDGAGSNSRIMAGINYAALRCEQAPSILSMSLGSSLSASVNEAIYNAYTKGCVIIAAAGNSNADACNYSPASASGVISVAATDYYNERLSYSNYGRCVDLYAPGTNIPSAWVNGETKTLSGTSMASPHVAGVAALFMADIPSFSNQEIYNELMNMGITIGVYEGSTTRRTTKILVQN